MSETASDKQTSRPTNPPENRTPQRTAAGRSASMELLEPFLALMPDAAVVVNADGRIVSANERAASTFGYAHGDLTGRAIETLIPERFRHHHRRHREDYAAAPRARPMGASLELFGRRADGSEFPVDISLAPVAGAEGPLVVAAIRDATERRSANAALAQLAAIVQSSMDAIVSVTLEGRITSWNPGAERLFAFTTKEAIDQHVSLLVGEGASDELEELMAAALAGQPGAPVDTHWRRRDGSEVDVALTVSLLHDPSGRPLGFSAILRDITERKAVEAELHRVLADERRRERQQAASAEIRLALLSGVDTEEALRLINGLACDLLGAEASILVTGQAGSLRIVAAAGLAEHLVGTSLADPQGMVGRIVSSTQTMSVADLAGDLDLDPIGGPSSRIGPALVSPLFSEGAVHGALVVFRRASAAHFDDLDHEVSDALAGLATLSLTLGRARDDQQRLLLAEDRERIARDLHDLVIQRLFASGMRLEALLRLTTDRNVIERVDRTVEELDATIRDIRSTIFALESPMNVTSGLRSELMDLADEAADGLGFAPVVRFDGPVDTTVPEGTRPHVLAVVREALSNAARHAKASRVEVELVVGDDIRLTVQDNGVGLGVLGRQSGLVNLRQRAEQLGGKMDVMSLPQGGTRLEWRVPRPG